METENKTDELYMHRCIELASKAKGLTYPNPMVGSVVVCDGKIIGEGYHRKAGTPHAEVHAINSVRDKAQLQRSTLYVCLEPCAHYGRTPPCAQLIIDSKIPRVVVGCLDPFPEVSGKGIDMMRKAGIDVTVGVCEEECSLLNTRFFTFHLKKRPYIILKWAETFDGYIGKIDSLGHPQPLKISDDQFGRTVHKMRAEETAIMIGVGTANSDNPSLTTRHWAGSDPIRVVIDPSLRCYENLTLLNDGKETIILNQTKESTEGSVRYVRVDFNSEKSCNEIVNKLGELGIQSVIIEGGSDTLQKFIAAKLYDEAWIHRSSMILGERGVKAPQIKMQGNINIDF